jgi:hypothetical protein
MKASSVIKNISNLITRGEGLQSKVFPCKQNLIVPKWTTISFKVNAQPSVKILEKNKKVSTIHCTVLKLTKN